MSAAREFAVRYRGQDRTLRVSLIRAWTREELPEPVMSTSSGPKDYIRNQVYMLFQAHPSAKRAALMRSAGALFLLLFDGSRYFDVSKRIVDIEEVPA